VPQPTALLHAPFEIKYHIKFLKLEYSKFEKQVKNFHQMTRLLEFIPLASELKDIRTSCDG